MPYYEITSNHNESDNEYIKAESYALLRNYIKPQPRVDGWDGVEKLCLITKLHQTTTIHL